MRVGDWIQTYTGKKFWPLDPKPEEIDPLDIAHALSLLCRYGGHCFRFYSVADHSIRCYEHLRKLESLLHDATEAYLVDLPRPIKRFIPQYQEIESKLARVIEERFNLNKGSLESPEVKTTDQILLSTEVRDLMVTGQEWSGLVTPLTDKIYPRTSEDSKRDFIQILERYGM